MMDYSIVFPNQTPEETRPAILRDNKFRVTPPPLGAGPGGAGEKEAIEAMR